MYLHCLEPWLFLRTERETACKKQLSNSSKRCHKTLMYVFRAKTFMLRIIKTYLFPVLNSYYNLDLITKLLAWYYTIKAVLLSWTHEHLGLVNQQLTAIQLYITSFTTNHYNNICSTCIQSFVKYIYWTVYIYILYKHLFNFHVITKWPVL